MIARLKTDAEKQFETLKVYDKKAYEAFITNGLPHRRVEEYKYTDLRNLIEEVIIAPQEFYVGGVRHDSKVEGLGANDPLVSMNYAFCDKGTLLHIKKDTTLTVQHDNKNFTRLFIIVEDGVNFTLIEHESPHNIQANRLTHITLGENAKFDHYYLQGNTSSQILNTIMAETATGSEFRSFTLNEGVKLCRNQFFITLNGDDSKLDLSGISILNGALHGDTTLQVKHCGLRGESREKYKYVLSDGAKGVFQGKIIVEKDAQKTDGKMASNAIMLTENCEMMNKPELEIYADDVLCGHGATCGELDDDLLFYLLARGIDKETARALLVQAFVGDALEQIENEAMREIIQERVEKRLTQH